MDWTGLCIFLRLTNQPTSLVLGESGKPKMGGLRMDEPDGSKASKLGKPNN